MKILVTGAAGFIGSALCARLSEDRNEVIGIDNYSNYYASDLKYMRTNFLLNKTNLITQELDICDEVKLENFIKRNKPDIVVNLAAQAGVRLDSSQNYKYVQNNLVGFFNIITVTVKEKIPFFLYASSSSVYGNTAHLPYTESSNILEPNSFYGATKLANEIFTSTLLKNSLTAARGLRLFTVYGPWGRPDMAYFRMISNVISGSQFKFYGDGSVERDLTYINDAVNCISLLIKDLVKRPPGFNDVVNIGGGNPVSMNKLKETIEFLTKSKIEFLKFDNHSNDITKTMSNPALLNSIIGTIPDTDLNEGMEETIAWAKNQNIKTMLPRWVNSVE